MSNYLEDDNGNKSAIRAMSMMALVAAIVFGWLVVSGTGHDGDGIKVTFAFLVAAFAPKVVQKFAEGKTP
jgi:hypothetical protein